MTNEQILNLFREWLQTYDEEEKDAIWQKQSAEFRNFWINKIMNPNYGELIDSELDEIIRYLDSHARGNTPETEATAAAMISQGMWRRMFNDIHGDKKLRETMDRLFNEKDDGNKIDSINRIYRLNEGRKNSLTGTAGNAINAMLFVHDPVNQISAISLNHRRKIVEFFNIENGPDFDNDDQGTKMIVSNRAIIEHFRKMGISNSGRTVSLFIYSPLIKDAWSKGQVDEPPVKTAPEQVPAKSYEKESNQDLALFYMESQLEDFLIENWEKTELGKKYDLIEENNEIVSQQYRTDIGIIDILAKDRKTGRYVVIELKKNQTSDDTIGQITRYMGWLEEHKTNGEPVQGIIIAARYDKRLYYALKIMKNIEVYLYRVDFKLNEFNPDT